MQSRHSTSGPRSRWRRPAGAIFVFVLFAGMLFWTKLRLVSDIPRSAYAVPKDNQPDQDRAAPDERPDREADAPDEQPED
ncbi:MAG: hypothetical protein K8E66_08605 [Phycisphaerales bacterium]|nr:hypothetical protein [Phycisphaerales bacterium]